MEHLRVDDVMTYRPLAIDPSTPLLEVSRLLEEHGFDCLPVTEDGALRGIVSQLDLLRALGPSPDGDAPPWRETMAQPVERIMTRGPLVVGPTTSLTDAVQLMIDDGARTLPVVLGALLIGIISRRDAFRGLSRVGRCEDEVVAAARSTS